MDLSFPTFQAMFHRRHILRHWYTSSDQRQALLRLIAVAVEENLSLIPLLESWAADEHGRQRNRIRRVIYLLNQGRTLPDAMEAVPGILREEDILAIRFDAQSGTRTAAIRSNLSEQQVVDRTSVVRTRRPLIYACVVLPISLLVIAFLHTKILPMLQKIFAEFGHEPSEAMRLSTSLTSGFIQGGWLLLLLAFIMLIILFSTRTGRSIRRATFGRLIRPLRKWYVGDVLQKIGLASDAGRPVAGALSTLARYHFDPQVRQELLFVRNEIEQGADIWNSMATTGMLTADDVRALRSSEPIGNLPWVLNQLAKVKKRHTARRLDRWSELVLPVVVLLLAAIVLVQVVAYFEPLTQLIHSMS